MTHERVHLADAVDRSTVRTASKLVLAALSVILLCYLASLLPGAEWLLPGTPITVIALAGAVATLLVVGLLLSLAPVLATFVRLNLRGPDAVVEDVASMVQTVVVLLTVLVAHRGLAPAITPLLEGATWVYDVVFLTLTLPLLVVLAIRLYEFLDPAADAVADRVAGGQATAEEADDGPEGV
ncbi:hypothetical protein ACFQGT_08220 [Natrialbaceae archaeon GCM10025810]|uniref:hypothetical protein n=1 Tax=Halovalidus salilacus TaxID=3075124 RepID=UPI00360AC0F0